MKRIFFYIILFFISKCIHGQISGYYSLYYTYYVSYYIKFYPNQYYFLGMRSEFDYESNISSWDVSFGRYIEDKNEIILSDKVHGYQLELSYEKDTLKMKSSFSWIKDKCFKNLGSVYDNSNVYNALGITKDMTLSLEQERKEYLLSHSKAYPINIGKYSDIGYAYSFKLNILADSTYSLELWMDGWKVALFEGIWNRNCNELILYDNNLKCNFYMLIGENKLISKLLPGDYKGVTLYYKGEK